MGYSLEQEGVLSAVMERFEKQRLPRVLKIKEKVDQGGRLDDADIAFLEEVFEDTLRVHVYRVRQKIEADPAQPRYIVTERGVGYSFLPQS